MFPNALISFLELLPRNSKDFKLSVKELNNNLRKVFKDTKTRFVESAESFMNSDNTIKPRYLNDIGSAKLASIVKSVFHLNLFGHTRSPYDYKPRADTKNNLLSSSYLHFQLPPHMRFSLNDTTRSTHNFKPKYDSRSKVSPFSYPPFKLPPPNYQDMRFQPSTAVFKLPSNYSFQF
ncbi:hypothetical protein SNE40_012385 [Patella caerulea]|uniref:Uncharacterized protein n=1 Tax=Patella caerulea TaxID=87958 RepID=A0AAN8PVU5_PATCE